MGDERPHGEPEQTGSATTNGAGEPSRDDGAAQGAPAAGGSSDDPPAQGEGDTDSY